MTKSSIFIAFGVCVWVLLATSMIWLANIGAVLPIQGNQFLEEGLVCDNVDCHNKTPVTLPYYTEIKQSADIETQRLQFRINVKERPTQPQAIFVPHYADDIFLKLNDSNLYGTPIGDKQPRRMWNTPLLISIPPVLINPGDNLLEIELSGYPQEGLILDGVHFGSYDILQSHYSWRKFTSVDIARFSVGIMLIFTLVLGVLGFVRRSEPEYLILALSCITAALFSIHYGFDMSFVPYWWWTIIWNLAVTVYVYLIMKFSNYYVKANIRIIEKIYAYVTVLEIACLLVAPAENVFLISMIFKLHPLIGALAIIVVFFHHRNNTDQTNFNIYIVCYTLGTSLGAYDLYMTAIEMPSRSQHLFQFTPLAMISVSIWLMISKLVQSLKNHEILAASLQDTIDAKTVELQQTYEKLGQAERQKAIHSERQRIMSDLHDGIGGQLVNTLAYMQNNEKGDEVMQNALEDALRDLSLMLDSLETDDSIVTLLGMLRTRLEALLEKHGLEFDWQIEDEPVLKNPSPSNNLHLTRIIQEAITNVIKHANATVITISTDATSVLIKDNGSGFKFNNEQKSGHGISGMKRRASQIGAHITFASDDDGTMIRLDLA